MAFGVTAHHVADSLDWLSDTGHIERKGRQPNLVSPDMAKTTVVEAEGTTPPVKKKRAVKAKANGNGHTKAKPKRAKVPVAQPDKFGFRISSLKSKAAAMYTSKKGATLAEVKAALKSSQFNVLTELESKKFKINRTEVPNGTSKRLVTRYQVSAP